MARCPFAKWRAITGSSGSYTGGPTKIVHHTTEGSSAAGAFAAFKANRSDPHFTVDQTTVASDQGLPKDAGRSRGDRCAAAQRFDLTDLDRVACARQRVPTRKLWTTPVGVGEPATIRGIALCYAGDKTIREPPTPWVGRLTPTMRP